MSMVTRTFPLEDIHIRSTAEGGDGRTVEAYATVFDVEIEVSDWDGQYREKIARTAFNKTLADKGLNFGVFYNHASTIYGTPSDRFSVPLGVPTEMRVEKRGLLTVSRYNNTTLADEILDSIRNGDIKGQSFSGKFLRSNPPRPRFGYERDTDGSLTVVTREEIALCEFGPTPFPYYTTAAIVGVRAEDISRALAASGYDPDNISDLTIAQLAAAMGRSTAPAAAPDEPPSTDAHSSREVMHAFQRARQRAREQGII